MYTDDQLLPISALQHWLFCPRQCGLIHLEQVWDENRLTAEGRQMHDKVHEADTENRPGIRIVRGLRIHSYRLGLIGQTDVVEFHQVEGQSEKGKGKIYIKRSQESEARSQNKDVPSGRDEINGFLTPQGGFGMTTSDGLARTNTDGHAAEDDHQDNTVKSPSAATSSQAFGMTNGVSLEGAMGLWQPFPVEYKRGKPKLDSCDEVQLCAQAMCLEEMLKTAIPKGAFFYGKPRRRKDVDISDSLRRQTEEAAMQLHELLNKGITPTAGYEKKCDVCSLYHRCLPKTTGLKKKIDSYLEKAFELPDFRDSIDD